MNETAFLLSLCGAFVFLTLLFYRNWILTKEKLKDAQKVSRTLKKMVQSRDALNDPNVVNSVLDELTDSVQGAASNNFDKNPNGKNSERAE